MKTDDVKLMIIENFIEHYTSDEAERAAMKNVAAGYVEEDHVDEIEQSGLGRIRMVKAHNCCDGCVFDDPKRPGKNCFHPLHSTMEPIGCTTPHEDYIFIDTKMV